MEEPEPKRLRPGVERQKSCCATTCMQLVTSPHHGTVPAPSSSQLTEKFSKLKAPGLPSGGDILRNAPHVGTNNLPTMPDAAEAIPKAGRNW